MPRGVVLLAVLVVIVLASLVGTTVLIVADADRAGAEVSLHRTQSRALAWSGVQAVMAELASQREELLDGKRPRVTDEWTLVSADEGAARGLYRLAPLGADGPLVSESAKLDLNTAPPEVLAKLPGVGPELAGRIAAARERTPFSSVEELLAVDGIGPDLLYGPTPDARGDIRKTISGAAGATALADLCTVFSFDPNVQLGLGPGGDGHRGEVRLNINTPWSERLERALVKRFSQNFSDAVKGVMDGRKFERDSDIVAVLNQFKIEPKQWVQTFDVFTTSPDGYLLGRVDVNTAPAEVLACIPGIDEAAAGRIVGLRASLDEETLGSVTWPAAEGILTPEQFAEAVDYLTTRSMQWRVRVEAGFEPAEGTTRPGGSGYPGGAQVDAAPKLRDRMVLEAVIDLASERPRVAYLRDISLLDVAREAFEKAGGEAPDAPEKEEAIRADAGAARADERDAGAAGASRPSRLDRVSSRLGAAQRQRADRFEPEEVPPLFGDVPALGDVPAEPEAGEAPVVAAPAAAAPVAGGGEVREAGPDRRIGRWNPAGGSQGGR